MVAAGEIVKVARGLYASGREPVTAHQVAAYGDRLADELLWTFERPMVGYAFSDLLPAARRAHATDAQALRKLQALREQGLVVGGTRRMPSWGLTEYGHSSHVYKPPIDIFS